MVEKDKEINNDPPITMDAKWKDAAVDLLKVYCAEPGKLDADDPDFEEKVKKTLSESADLFKLTEYKPVEGYKMTESFIINWVYRMAKTDPGPAWMKKHGATLAEVVKDLKKDDPDNGEYGRATLIWLWAVVNMKSD